MHVVTLTCAGALACTGTALLLDAGNFPHLTDEELVRSILADILVPLLVAAPILFLLLGRLRALTIEQDKALEHTATDELTGLMTRRAFVDDVEEELADARFAEDGVRGTLLIIDIDELKAINDRFGHEQGDAALQLIARSVRNVLRAADRVGRIGGDEFAVFLPATSPLVADAVAERIRLAITKTHFAPDETPMILSVSVGGATYDRWLPYAELFRLAEQQLYAAKSYGRNRVSVSSISRYDAVPAMAA